MTLSQFLDSLEEKARAALEASMLNDGSALRGSCEASWYTGSKGAGGALVGNYAAHKTLRFGTVVRVHYLNRSVDITIRDRGPYIAGRCLDLAKHAFAQLASTGTGTIDVRWEVI